MELAAAARDDTGAARLKPSAPIFPPLPVLLGGALGWGALMAAGAVVSLTLQGRAENFQLLRILAIYFAGGLAAWPIALPVARVLTRHRPFETRFAAHFALLSLGTIAVTAFFFALDYRLFYAQWHHPPGTRIWLYQFVFTIAGAVYQFLVMGLSLYLPVGLPVVAGASLWLSRSKR